MYKSVRKNQIINRMFSKLVRLVACFSLLFLFVFINGSKVEAEGKLDLYANTTSWNNSSSHKFYTVEANDIEEWAPTDAFSLLNLVGSSSNSHFVYKDEENSILFVKDGDSVVLDASPRKWLPIGFFDKNGNNISFTEVQLYKKYLEYIDSYTWPTVLLSYGNTNDALRNARYYVFTFVISNSTDFIYESPKLAIHRKDAIYNGWPVSYYDIDLKMIMNNNYSFSLEYYNTAINNFASWFVDYYELSYTHENNIKNTSYFSNRKISINALGSASVEIDSTNRYTRSHIINSVHVATTNKNSAFSNANNPFNDEEVKINVYACKEIDTTNCTLMLSKYPPFGTSQKGTFNLNSHIIHRTNLYMINNLPLDNYIIKVDLVASNGKEILVGISNTVKIGIDNKPPTIKVYTINNRARITLTDDGGLQTSNTYKLNWIVSEGILKCGNSVNNPCSLENEKIVKSGTTNIITNNDGIADTQELDLYGIEGYYNVYVRICRFDEASGYPICYISDSVYNTIYNNSNDIFCKENGIYIYKLATPSGITIDYAPPKITASSDENKKLQIEITDYNNIIINENVIVDNKPVKGIQGLITKCSDNSSTNCEIVTTFATAASSAINKVVITVDKLSIEGSFTIYIDPSKITDNNNNRFKDFNYLEYNGIKYMEIGQVELDYNGPNVSLSVNKGKIELRISDENTIKLNEENKPLFSWEIIKNNQQVSSGKYTLKNSDMNIIEFKLENSDNIPDNINEIEGENYQFIISGDIKDKYGNSFACGSNLYCEKISDNKFKLKIDGPVSGETTDKLFLDYKPPELSARVENGEIKVKLVDQGRVCDELLIGNNEFYLQRDEEESEVIRINGFEFTSKSKTETNEVTLQINKGYLPEGTYFLIYEGKSIKDASENSITGEVTIKVDNVDYKPPEARIYLQGISATISGANQEYISKNESIKIVLEDMNLSNDDDLVLSFMVNATTYSTIIKASKCLITEEGLKKVRECSEITFDELIDNINLEGLNEQTLRNTKKSIRDSLKSQPITFVSINGDIYNNVQTEFVIEIVDEETFKNSDNVSIYVDIVAPTINTDLSCGENMNNFCYNLNNLDIIFDDEINYNNEIGHNFVSLVDNKVTITLDKEEKSESTYTIIKNTLKIGDILIDILSKSEKTGVIEVKVEGSVDDGFSNKLPFEKIFYFSNSKPNFNVKDAGGNTVSSISSISDNLYVIDGLSESVSITVTNYDNVKYTVNKDNNEGEVVGKDKSHTITFRNKDVDVYEVRITPLVMDASNGESEVSDNEVFIYIARFKYEQEESVSVELTNHNVSIVEGKAIISYKKSQFNNNLHALSYSSSSYKVINELVEDLNANLNYYFESDNIISWNDNDDIQINNIKSVNDLNNNVYDLKVKYDNIIIFYGKLNFNFVKENFIVIDHTDDINTKCDNSKICNINLSDTSHIRIKSNLFNNGNNVEVWFETYGTTETKIAVSGVANKNEISGLEFNINGTGTLTIYYVMIEYNNEAVTIGNDKLIQEYTYIIHSIPPTFDIEFNDNQVSKNNNLYINGTSFSVVDVEVSGDESNVYYKFDNNSYSKISLNSDNEYKVIDDINLGDGEHTLYVKVSDKYGNVTSLNKSFIVDRTAPSVSYNAIGRYADGSWEDLLKGINQNSDKLYYSVDISRNGDINDSGVGGSKLTINKEEKNSYSCITNGTYEVSLVVSDELGNYREDIYHFNIDRNNLTLTFSENSKKISKDNPINISFNFNLTEDKVVTLNDMTFDVTAGASLYGKNIVLDTSNNSGVLTFSLLVSNTSLEEVTIKIPEGLYVDKTKNKSNEYTLTVLLSNNTIDIVPIDNGADAKLVNGIYYISSIDNVIFEVKGVTVPVYTCNSSVMGCDKWEFNEVTKNLTYTNSDLLTTITIPAGTITEDSFANESKQYQIALLHDTNIEMKIISDSYHISNIQNSNLYLKRSSLVNNNFNAANNSIVVAVKYLNDLNLKKDIAYYVNAHIKLNPTTIVVNNSEEWIRLELNIPSNVKNINFTVNTCNQQNDAINLCILNFNDVSGRIGHEINVNMTYGEETINNNVIIDGDAPKISDIKYTKEYVKVNQTITFNVSDLASGSGIKEVLWSKDNISYSSLVACTSCSITTDFENMTSGDHNIYVKAKDNLGNEVTEIVTIKLDVDAPRISIIPNSYTTYKKEHYVSFNASDEHSGVKESSCKVNNGSKCVIVGNKAYIENQKSLTGIFEITIIVIDKVGNETTITQQVYLDNESPSITITGGEYKTPKKQHEVLFTVNENEKLLDNPTCKVNDNNCIVVINEKEGGYKAYIENQTSLTGEFNITITAEDEAGNTFNITQIVSLDNTAPSISVATNENVTMEKHFLSLLVTHKFSDKGSKIETMKYCIIKINVENDTPTNCDGLETINITSLNGEITFDKTIIKESGRYAVIYEASDEVGNYSNADIEFNLDVVAPSVNLSFIVEENGETCNTVYMNRCKLVLEVTDDASGVDLNSLELIFKRITNTDKDDIVKDSGYIINKTFSSPDNKIVKYEVTILEKEDLVGEFYPVITVSDVTKNKYESNFSNIRINIDNQAPTITWTNENGYIDSNDDTNKLEITLEINDNHKLIANPIRIDGKDKDYFKCDRDINTSNKYDCTFITDNNTYIERRKYSFIVYAYDEGGNVSSKEINVNYTRPTLKDIKIILKEKDTNTQIDVTNDPVIIIGKNKELNIEYGNNYKIKINGIEINGILQQTMFTYVINETGKYEIRVIDSIGNISLPIEKYVFKQLDDITITKEDGEEVKYSYDAAYYGEVIDSSIKYKNVYKELKDSHVIYLVNDVGGKYKLIKTLIKDNMNSEQTLIGGKILDENTIVINNKKYLLILVEDNKDKANELRKELNPDTSNPSEIIDSGSKKESGESSKVDVTVLVTIAIIFSVVGGFFAVRRLRRRVRSA